MDIQSQIAEEVLIVELKGTLNITHTPQFQEKMNGLLAKIPRALILDCSQTDYISSIGLRAILGIGKNLHSQDSELILVAPEGFAAQIFENAGFGLLFKIVPSLSEAKMLTNQ